MVFVGEIDVKSHQDENNLQRHVHAEKSHPLSNPVEDRHFTVNMQLKVSSPNYNVYTRYIVFAVLRKIIYVFIALRNTCVSDSMSLDVGRIPATRSFS